MMAVLTLLSRVAASAMVPKVQVGGGENKSLSYDIEGTGTIKENAKKYMELQSGYKISKVSVKEGQQIDEKDLLFTYDLKQLEEKKSTLEMELKKLQLSYQKADLSGNNSNDTKKEAEAKANAEEDLRLATAMLGEMKTTVKNNKEEDYEAAKSEWEDTEAASDAAIGAADRTVNDAELELEEFTKPQQEAETVIKDYKVAVTTASEELIQKAQTAIVEFYYGDGYAEHQKDVEEAQEKMNRAKEDLKDINSKWDGAINFWDQFSSEDSIKKAYKDQIQLRDAEIKSANRIIADIQETIDELTKEDLQLEDAISYYRSCILLEAPVSAYEALYKLLYDNLKLDEVKMNTAKTMLSRAKEDFSQTEKDWDKKVDTAYDKVEKLKKELSQIKDGSYDYQEDLKDIESVLRNSERELKSAELGLENAEQTQKNNEESIKIELSSIEIDIQAKKKEIKQIQNIIDKNGEVTSPVSGVILTSELEEGITLTGQEKLIISTGGFELSMMGNKEDMKNFSEGDKVDIKITDNQEKITSSIENIEMPDAEGNVSFTALLPEGEYKSGAVLEYELLKSSEDYSMCIPIQALRQDSKSTFILLAKESDSVLGKMLSAFRLDVKVISQDAKTAAIEASLSEEDMIIVGSNKNIAEGDRVQVETQ